MEQDGPGGGALTLWSKCLWHAFTRAWVHLSFSFSFIIRVWDLFINQSRRIVFIWHLSWGIVWQCKGVQFAMSRAVAVLCSLVARLRIHTSGFPHSGLPSYISAFLVADSRTAANLLNSFCSVWASPGAESRVLRCCLPGPFCPDWAGSGAESGGLSVLCLSCLGTVPLPLAGQTLTLHLHDPVLRGSASELVSNF